MKIDLNQLRQVQWSASYDWEIRIEDPNLPEPFNKFFPVITVDEELGNVESQTFEIYNRNYSVPSGLKQNEITITFHDDSNHTLEKWMENWVNIEIFHQDEANSYVSTLKTACKEMHIAKTDRGKKVKKLATHLVYPNGQFTFSGSAEADATIFTMQFNVVATKTNNY